MNTLTSIPAIVVALLSAGAGGIITGLATRWLDHLRDKRKQTDDVAMDLVAVLSKKVDAIEIGRETDRKAAALENRLCEANLTSVRHELRNVEAAFDALLLALRHAPPERHDAIITELGRWREEQRRTEATRRGDVRNDVQAAVSAARVAQDMTPSG